MKLTSLLITMLLVGALFVGFYSMLGTLSSEKAWNTSNINLSYMESYNKLTNISLLSEEMTSQTQNISESTDKSFFTGVWDAFTVTKNAILGTGKITKSSVSIAKDMTTQTINDLNLDSDDSASGIQAGSYISGLLITILTILVLGIILYIITRVDW